MIRCLRACFEEFDETREIVGDLGALAFVSVLVAITLVGLVIVLILGLVLLALLPMVLAIASAMMLVPRWGRTKPGGTRLLADPWLSE